MNCLYCGSVLPEDAAVCPVCGQTTEISPAQPSDAEPYAANSPYKRQRTKKTPEESAEKVPCRQPEALPHSANMPYDPQAVSNTPVSSGDESRLWHQDMDFYSGNMPFDSQSVKDIPISPVDYSRYQQPDSIPYAGDPPREGTEQGEATVFQTQYGVYSHQQSGDPKKGGKFTALYVGFQKAAFRNALREMPGRWLKSFLHPEQLIRELTQKADLAASLLVLIALMIFSFLSGMFFTRAFSRVGISGMLSLFTGREAEAFVRQVSSLSWGTAAAMGGFAVLFQLLFLLLTSGIPLLYGCVFQKKRFSPELLLALVTVEALPKLATLLLVTLLSLLSPWAALLPMLLQAGILLFQEQAITRDFANQQESAEKAVWAICLFTLLLLGVVAIFAGGSLMIQRLLAFWNSNLERMVAFLL